MTGGLRGVRSCIALWRSFLLAVGAVLMLEPATSVAASAAPSDVALAPVVHCAWALAGAGDATTFTYGPAAGTNGPLAGASAPCALDSQGVVRQSVDAPDMVQLVVDPATAGGNDLELWAAVSHPTSDAFGAGEGTVKWSLLRPDGQLMGQVVPIGRSCAGTSDPGAMWNAAATGEGAGVFAPSTVTNDRGNGLWQECRQGRVRLFYGRVRLPADAPCGTYAVAVIAAVGEASTRLDFGFEVLCPAKVVLDATSIAWNVEPGGSATIAGDLDTTTPGAPTLTNVGRSPAQVGLVFTALRRQDRPEVIAQFGSMLTPESADVTGISRMPAHEEGWFPGASGVLCPGASVRLDLTVYAPSNIAPGEYAGTIRVVARPGGRC